MKLEKIISGGQTGADWAALVAAKDMDIPTGGTAPKGWRIQLPNGQDSSNPRLEEFGLVEHVSREWRYRTIQNVLDADGTLWVGYESSGGGKLTLGTAIKNGKPFIVNPTPEALLHWVTQEGIKVLNVAGNRLSEHNPGIEVQTYRLLTRAFHGPLWPLQYPSNMFPWQEGWKHD